MSFSGLLLLRLPFTYSEGKPSSSASSADASPACEGTVQLQTLLFASECWRLRFPETALSLTNTGPVPLPNKSRERLTAEQSATDEGSDDGEAKLAAGCEGEPRRKG